MYYKLQNKKHIGFKITFWPYLINRSECKGVTEEYLSRQSMINMENDLNI